MSTVIRGKLGVEVIVHDLSGAFFNLYLAPWLRLESVLYSKATTALFLSQPMRIPAMMSHCWGYGCQNCWVCCCKYKEDLSGHSKQDIISVTLFSLLFSYICSQCSSVNFPHSVFVILCFREPFIELNFTFDPSRANDYQFTF